MSLEPQHNADKGIFIYFYYYLIQTFSVWSLITVTIHYYITVIGSESEEEAASIHAASDDSGCSPAEKRRRKDAVFEPCNDAMDANKAPSHAVKRARIQSKLPLAKKTKIAANSGEKKTFTVAGVHASFPEKTKYGSAFRAISTEEKISEVARLNK